MSANRRWRRTRRGPGGPPLRHCARRAPCWHLLVLHVRGTEAAAAAAAAAGARMSFANAVNYECGSKFIRYFDCTSRQDRRVAQGDAEALKQAAATQGSPGDPCAKARTAMQLCMVDIYIESVCSKPLHELSECAREHRAAQPAKGKAGAAASASPCEEIQRRFENCSIAAVEGKSADAAFQRFLEEGRTWKSPTKGRMSMMHVPGYQVESTLSSAVSASMPGGAAGSGG